MLARVWRYVAFVWACGIVGCSPEVVRTNYDAAPQFYRAECDVEPWKIAGIMEDENHDDVPVRRIVKITIDGKKVIHGQISAGRDATGELSGRHGDKEIAIICNSVPRPQDNYYEVRCQVLVDRTRTVTLTF